MASRARSRTWLASCPALSGPPARAAAAWVTAGMRCEAQAALYHAAGKLRGIVCRLAACSCLRPNAPEQVARLADTCRSEKRQATLCYAPCTLACSHQRSLSSRQVEQQALHSDVDALQCCRGVRVSSSNRSSRRASHPRRLAAPVRPRQPGCPWPPRARPGI